MKRTYGELHLVTGHWVLKEIPPHVSIKLKNLFRKIPKTQKPPYVVKKTGESSADLKWFSDRYPLIMAEAVRAELLESVRLYEAKKDEIEAMLASGVAGRQFSINGTPRSYQPIPAAMVLALGDVLCGDDVGLGKTLEAILLLTEPATQPALIVCQTHLPVQWAAEIVRFIGAKPHIVKSRTPYALPRADVYIMSYSKLLGWTDVFRSGFFKTVIFDEIQELRIPGSEKYRAALALSENTAYRMGLSATPVYNYGDEIHAVLHLIRPGALGSKEAFLREWTGGWPSREVKDPAALGTYLRDEQLFIRRTKRDVGRELPTLNRILHTVEHSNKDQGDITELTRALAKRVFSGSFTERGQAARELDLMLRMATGVGKARSVAAYVNMLLESGYPVLLAGWHRSVYDIWLKELSKHKPVMYTGSESPAQKEAAKQAFISGQSNLMIMSLRSGVGVDGLQKRCSDVVIGELDWSPAVHRQLIGRVDRDGQTTPVTAHFMMSEWGSDPVMVDLLGLKASQAEGINDPVAEVQAVHADDSRVKELARRILGEAPPPQAIQMETP